MDRGRPWDTNMVRPAKKDRGLYNQRGTCEQWIKEGKGAIKWTRLSCIPSTQTRFGFNCTRWLTILETSFARLQRLSRSRTGRPRACARGSSRSAQRSSATVGLHDMKKQRLGLPSALKAAGIIRPPLEKDGHMGNAGFNYD